METAKAQQAEKEREQNEYFEMAEDEPIQINTMGVKAKQTVPITEEQQQRWEVARLEALERKRLRELKE